MATKTFLKRESKISSTFLNFDNFRKILFEMKENNWSPCFLESTNKMFELFNIPSNLFSENYRPPFNFDSAYTTDISSYEIFVQQDEIYYCLISDGKPFFSNDEKTEPYVELGIISNSYEILDKLESFISSFQIIWEKVLGAEETPIDINWKHKGSNTSDFKEFSHTNYVRASILKEDIEVTQLLVENRILLTELVELNKAVYITENDWSAKAGSENLQNIISQLTNNNLISLESLVSCKKTNQSLIKYKDLNLEDLQLTCPNCNRAFKDERIQKIYSLTELSKRIIQKSNWMTIWVTNKLLELGVPEADIVWNLQDGNEEIDIVINFLEKRWIFELKDREFSAGDAYPLKYRQAKFKSSKVVVISTDRISKDARKVLDNQSDKTNIYIEGLTNLVGILESEFSKIHIENIFSAIRDIDDLSGFYIKRLIKLKYNLDEPSSNY